MVQGIKSQKPAQTQSHRAIALAVYHDRHTLAYHISQHISHGIFIYQKILAMRSCSYHSKLSKFNHLAGKSRMSNYLFDKASSSKLWTVLNDRSTAWVKWVKLEVAFAMPTLSRRSRRLPRPGHVASRPSTMQRSPHGRPTGNCAGPCTGRGWQVNIHHTSTLEEYQV